MEWASTQQSGALVARPSGKIDEASWQRFADRLIAAVHEAAGTGLPLVVDLSAVDYMSSRGLRALTLARKEAGDTVEIVLAAANPRMREILAISRYDKIFRVTDAIAGGVGPAMRVRFWGTRGSLPVALRAEAVADKIARALVAADGRRFAGVAEARDFAVAALGFPARATYGGATSCVEIEGGDGSFTVCDMGSGLREFGLSAMKRAGQDGRPKVFNIFLSHMHWDHIMGFPFFVPAFDPGAKIVIHGGHPDIETALRRQQEQISFPVAFDWLRADISFRTLVPGETYRISGYEVALIKQYHSYDSYGFRFRDAAGTVAYSTDSEHKADDMEGEAAFEAFFRGADLVIFDTMYSLGDAVTMKADWGHSSNLVAVDICQAAAVRRLALFHHEPTYSDDDIARMHDETVRYEELNRQGRPALGVLCAYDGLEVAI